VNECDYLVDQIDLDKIPPNEPNYAANTSEWKILAEQEFLNSEKSHQFLRAFYVPFVSSEHTKYNTYVLLKRIRKKNAKLKKRGREFYEDDI
jgi:alpha-1,2-mannosyltransferase